MPAPVVRCRTSSCNRSDALLRPLAILVVLLQMVGIAAAQDRPHEALDLINGFRAQHGLATLRMEARLALLARDQAWDMPARRRLD